MAYLGALGAGATNGLGAPPTARPQIGTAPAIAPAQGHIEPPPYDVAMDPGWKGIVDPADHELRNILNGMSPEERQVLQQRVQMILDKMKGPAPAATPRMPGAI